jgi:hypothetical protein
MRTYTVQIPPTVIALAGVKTLIQVVAGTNRGFRLLSAYLGQTASTTNQQVRVRILRKTAAATVTAFTPIRLVADDTAFTGTAGNNATVEGTNGDVVVEDMWSALSGWVYKPNSEEYIQVPGAGILAMVIPAAFTADLTMTGYMTIQEMA